MEVDVNSESEVSVELTLLWISLVLIEINDLKLLLWTSLAQWSSHNVSHLSIMGDVSSY